MQAVLYSYKSKVIMDSWQLGEVNIFNLTYLFKHMYQSVLALFVFYKYMYNNMLSVVIGSFNCRGLAEKVKRNDIFTLCRYRYDISVLIDTHSCNEYEKLWSKEWGYVCKFSSHSSRSRGVAVLFKNSFDFKINRESLDINGNYVILDLTVQENLFTLVAIYSPNEDNLEFFST